MSSQDSKAMIEIGYALSSEAHAPNDVIRYMSERLGKRYGRMAQGRLEMLEEAVQVIRLLWRGGMQSH
jgi:hypothetical protein